MFPLALPMVDSLVIRVQVRGHLLRELSLPITTGVLLGTRECPVLATVTFLGFTFFMPLHHLTLILWTYFTVSFHKGL